METLVGQKTTGIMYRAKDLADLAQHFQMLAEKEEGLRVRSQTVRDGRVHGAQAAAYRDAAETLRATVLEPVKLDGAQQLDADRAELKRLAGAVPRPFVLDALAAELSLADVDELLGKVTRRVFRRGKP